MKEAYICDRCGGHINRATMQCEYCGTRFREENDNVIRIETFRNPVREFSVKAVIPDFYVREMGCEAASRICMNELTQKMAECLPQLMNVRVEMISAQNLVAATATLKGIVPVETGGLCKTEVFKDVMGQRNS